MKILNIIILTLAAFLTGCNTLQTENLPIREAVMAGTLAYIDSNPDNAQRVADFVEIVRTLSEDELDFVEIQNLINESVDFTELEPYQALIIQAVMARVVEEINAQGIDPSNQVDLEMVLVWIELAARSYLEE